MYYIDRGLVKQNARSAIRANYWPIIGWSLLGEVILTACGCIPAVGWIAAIFIAPVVSAGLCYFSYKLYCGENAGSAELFAGFNDFIHIVGGIWWMYLFSFLWSLLFVIPGVIKGISYSMTPFILIDRPDVGARDALKLSMEMTRGHKWEIFKMYLSFIGWGILTALTGGILAVFYTGPYMNITLAGYYYELKAMYESSAREETEE